MKLTEQQIEERVQRSIDFFLAGYNCSQSVFCALCDLYDVSNEMALKLSASFGGGIGRMRLTCGAASGMFLLAGFEKGQTLPNDPAQKLENYRVVQALAADFKREHGSMTCSELLQLRKDAPTPPMPDPRNEAYYHQRPCLRMITSAVRIFCEHYNNNFA